MEYVLLFFAALTAIGYLLKLFSKDNSTESEVSKAKSSQKRPEQKKPVKEQASKPKKEKPIVQPIPSPPKSESKPPVSKAENKTNSFVTLPSSPASSKNRSNPTLNDAEFQLALVERMDTHGKLEAVKFAMEVKGWGLKQAKTYCDQLFAMPSSKKVKNTSPASDILSETKEKMRLVGKLEAIKFLMAKTGLSLPEAKKYCDQLEKELKSSANASKPIPTSNPKNGARADAQHETIALEEEIKKLMANTKWDYATAKAYCEQALEYKKKIAVPARLKKK